MLNEFLESPSMLAIFPLQDWVALDAGLRRPDRDAERSNQPADPHHYWRYRVHFDLERLREPSELNVTVAGLIKDAGRAV